MRRIAMLTMSAAAMAAMMGMGQPARPDFSGEWKLMTATGTTPPDGFVMRTNQSATSLEIISHWNEPENGRYGLTLVGLLAPRLLFSFNGREDLNQAGPFVLHSKTRWDGARLLTDWSTSEFLGASFKGQWVYSMSGDGRELRVEIHTDSSQGQHSDAVLTFQKR